MNEVPFLRTYFSANVLPIKTVKKGSLAIPENVFCSLYSHCYKNLDLFEY